MAPYNMLCSTAFYNFVTALCQDYAAVPDLDQESEEQCMYVIAYLENNSGIVRARARFQTSTKTWDPLVFTDEHPSIGALHTQLASQSMISKREATGNRLTVRVYAWIPRNKHELKVEI
ncbi:hypothetical protein K439DRAFT_322645 [Ramaria rubella]|nr:hypothetical protein K439DRAFT_322645 [Ramaria rubella]